MSYIKICNFQHKSRSMKFHSDHKYVTSPQKFSQHQQVCSKWQSQLFLSQVSQSIFTLLHPGTFNMLLLKVRHLSIVNWNIVNAENKHKVCFSKLCNAHKSIHQYKNIWVHTIYKIAVLANVLTVLTQTSIMELARSKFLSLLKVSQYSSYY